LAPQALCSRACPSAPCSQRLHDPSTTFGAVQQPNRRVERRRAQVHVPITIRGESQRT
jgi:hypothetical protein